jgi:hypothetical protein
VPSIRSIEVVVELVVIAVTVLLGALTYALYRIAAGLLEHR